MHCRNCGSELEVRGKRGANIIFLACSQFFTTGCKGSESISDPENMRCVKCGSYFELALDADADRWVLKCKGDGCDGQRVFDIVAPGAVGRPASIPSELPAPTDEQKAILAGAEGSSSMLLRALAGTGKTTTLEMLAGALPGKTLYVAFNSAIVREADSRFGGIATCKTFHALARGVMRTSNDRLNGKPDTARLVEAIEARPLRFSSRGETIAFSPRQLAEFAQLTVKAFCRTGDQAVSDQHVRIKTGFRLEADARTEVRAEVEELARRLWALYVAPANRGLPYSGDHQIYAKMWQLSSPLLDYDTILFDEAQDADPVMLDLMRSQRDSRVVYCGDDYQALYEWRGAVNALGIVDAGFAADEVSGERFWLTESFRFGPRIAEEAQRLLSLLDCPATIQGKGSTSTVGEISRPRAIICRNNGTVLRAFGQALNDGLHPHIAGGLAERIGGALDAVESLQAGVLSDHPMFAAFRSWADAVEWAEADEQALDADAALIRLIANRTVKQLRYLLSRNIKAEPSADVVITNAHQAKGRQWETVRLEDDFPHPENRGDDEARWRESVRVAYVAVTRAQRGLDLGEGLWSADPDPTLGKGGRVIPPSVG